MLFIKWIQVQNLTFLKFRFQSSKFATLDHSHMAPLKMIYHLDYIRRLSLRRVIEPYHFRTITESCELDVPNFLSHSHKMFYLHHVV